MSLDLYVDGPRWRDHLRAVRDATPGLVPVAKGNGYGLGMASLARRTQWLGRDTIAVGCYREIADVEQRFDGDILVMEPWRRGDPQVRYGPRILHTVSRFADLAEIGRADDHPRVVAEGLTSIGRHGMAPDELGAARGVAGIRLAGHALHLPLGGGHAAEVERWLAAAPSDTWWVSHLTADELGGLRERYAGVELRPRIGTALWLGDRDALSARATVLDAHEVRRGQRIGYRQGRVPRSGTVLVVSGGTAHGIGLEAPSSARSARERLGSAARGGLDVAGFARSPFVVAGRHRWFVEPPHMQVSMLLLPTGAPVPAIGEQVAVHVRFTTTHFDSVTIS